MKQKWRKRLNLKMKNYLIWKNKREIFVFENLEIKK